MNFCPACGALLLFHEEIQEVTLVCKTCNYNMDINKNLLSEVPLRAKKKDDVLVKDWSKEAQISARCPDCKLAGRIAGKREAGKKLCFYDLRCENGDKVQVLAEKQYFEGDFRFENQNLRRGDVIGVVGFPGKSNRGELSVIPRQIRLLAPCEHPLPTEHQPIEDSNLRFQRRYVDMLCNRDAVEALKARSRTIQFIRNYLDTRDFIEVETPILSSSSGGANATPFETHSFGLNTNLKLRISPELYLKQLLVGGLDRVYEIGKVFRNEGISPVHAPEFTTCEFYMTYANHKDLMRLTEDMLSNLVTHITGSSTLTLPRSMARNCFSSSNENSSDSVDIDFSGSYKQLDVMTELRNECGDIPCTQDTSTFHDAIREICETHDAMPKTHPFTTARMLDSLIGKVLEPQCLHPTFIVGHPLALSPLSRSCENEFGDIVSERFELFAAGKELINAYSELNDPRDQRERFKLQTSAREAGDSEGMFADERFCVALEHGMPPAAGWGLGIDRLIMMLTGSQNIREVQSFPL
eukprot:g2868.t1